ncbi:MAG: hypothetical protein GQ527_08705, partial [Bacteroidales bacterium]|nr:hypothetical protein [Bacteroidales bacterium]
MSHWLEEAESKAYSKRVKHSEVHSRVENKKTEVKDNKDLIGDSYLDVIDQFISIIQRINNLPRNERIPFGQIESKFKDNKLDNLLHKFSSSRRINIREYSGILAPFKSQRYKNSRSFFISIAREKGKILLEYKEIRSKRIKLDDQITRFWSFLPFVKNKSDKNSHETLEKIKI